eukprot:m.38033 g.38033  ORF g.38033 m.38033 type:complete len:308 (+) comp12571_c0_seq1:266-1189(+)
MAETALPTVESTSLMVDSESWVTLTVLLCAAAVGSVGLLPIWLIPAAKMQSKAEDILEAPWLRSMLGIACGGLLGNVFLHLLPEAMMLASKESLSLREFMDDDGNPILRGYGHHHDLHDAHMQTGFFTLAGIMVFFVLEKAATVVKEKHDAMLALEDQKRSADTMGYLNILVNLLDNFTHGLAVATAFSVNHRTGVLTTIAVVAHEIPHELGDYAILLKSGFNVQEAFLSQLITSSGSLAGAVVGLSMDTHSMQLKVLPFTAGGFCYVAMVNLVPELLTPLPSWNWWKDVLAVTFGVALVLLTMSLD